MSKVSEYSGQINNLARLVNNFFESYGDRPMFSCVGKTVLFKQVDRASKQFASYLQNVLKLEAGDRIAIQLPNLIQYPVAVYGAIRAGLIIVNTNPLYTSREMQHQFLDSGAKAIVILEDLLPKFEEIKNNLNIDHVIVTKITDDLDGTASSRNDNYLSFMEMTSQQDESSYCTPSAELDDICILQYTGGTTGVSKGAALTHKNIISNLYQTSERLGVKECHDVLVCPLPVYHIYAFLIGLIVEPAKGNQTILIPNPRDLDAFIKQICQYKFTTFAGLNTLFVGLCNHPEFRRLDFSHLRLTISGGTALTQAASDLWQEITGCPISEGYGLSETSPVVALNNPNDIAIGTVGEPVFDTEIEFWDDNDKPVEDGERGQLVCKGPQVMAGYWNRPEETATVLTKDGFFKTGDIGLRLPDGKIKIVDRLKDMIIVSGFNVFPNEVEDILVKHPDVLEAAVVGEVDDKTGERVCAYITTRNAVDEEVLKNYCREHLAAYKIPKKIMILDELPKSSVGKILRRELRK